MPSRPMPGPRDRRPWEDADHLRLIARVAARAIVANLEARAAVGGHGGRDHLARLVARLKGARP